MDLLAGFHPTTATRGMILPFFLLGFSALSAWGHPANAGLANPTTNKRGKVSSNKGTVE
jgi:hypothetical protein